VYLESSNANKGIPTIKGDGMSSTTWPAASPASQPLTSQPGTTVPAYNPKHNPNPSGKGGGKERTPLGETDLVLKKEPQKSH